MIKCGYCDKRVYPAEDGKMYHKCEHWAWTEIKRKNKRRYVTKAEKEARKKKVLAYDFK